MNLFLQRNLVNPKDSLGELIFAMKFSQRKKDYFCDEYVFAGNSETEMQIIYLSRPITMWPQNILLLKFDVLG